MSGGTSFSAIRLTYLLWKQFSLEIPFSALIQHPTIDQVTNYINSLTSRNDNTNNHYTYNNNGKAAQHQKSVYLNSTDVQIVCLQKRPHPSSPTLYLVHPAFWYSISYLELSTHFAGICAAYQQHTSNREEKRRREARRDNRRKLTKKDMP